MVLCVVVVLTVVLLGVAVGVGVPVDEVELGVGVAGTLPITMAAVTGGNVNCPIVVTKNNGAKMRVNLNIVIIVLVNWNSE